MFPFQEHLARLGLEAGDFEESFARSGGPGGQHVNKVSTAVTLRHRPSGLAVTVQDSRSQSANRSLARERLLAAIEKRPAPRPAGADRRPRENPAAEVAAAAFAQTPHPRVEAASFRRQGATAIHG